MEREVKNDRDDKQDLEEIMLWDLVVGIRIVLLWVLSNYSVCLDDCENAHKGHQYERDVFEKMAKFSQQNLPPFVSILHIEGFQVSEFVKSQNKYGSYEKKDRDV